MFNLISYKLYKKRFIISKFKIITSIYLFFGYYLTPKIKNNLYVNYFINKKTKPKYFFINLIYYKLRDIYKTIKYVIKNLNLY